MLHTPPPCRHRFLSAARAHEKVVEMGVRSGWETLKPSSSAFVGGRQVAEVKVSTALSMKNLGKVPPRFETLYLVRKSGA